MTVVRITMRALSIVAALAGLARADDIHEVPDQAVTIGVLTTGGAIGPVQSGGLGFDVELALGHRRTQYFLEGSLIEEKVGAVGDRIPARGSRAIVGVRRLARSFELGDKGAIDLHFEAYAGYSRLSIEHARAIQRPEFGVGVGYQIRGFMRGLAYPRSQLGFRLSARALFAPTDRDDLEIACRGTCRGSPSRTGSGLMVVFGVQL